MLLLTERELFTAKLENLERLARAIGADLPRKIAREGEYRRKLVLAVVRQEYRLSQLRKSNVQMAVQMEA